MLKTVIDINVFIKEFKLMFLLRNFNKEFSL